ncbi:rho GTPase-activating protein 20-like isoform X2 [Ornithorhynchus anatinus]|uniref:rho GTPase-activating protein 20-like isoform X2 n=1 Tax=Ornithorhynchus anatinus TaxID=9258 RepID=UPI0010A82149|nr:rho GTPase-activating protein 20-like isoform X2 [Ornithorhynchus anatinus]
MKPTAPGRRSTPSAISRALSKSRTLSRESPPSPTLPTDGPALGAFCAPGSVFIMDERVQLTTGLQTQDRHLFLFNDTLVVAKSKSSSSLKVKKQVGLSEVWTATCLGEVSEKRASADHSFVLGWPTANCVVTFSSSETKERWLSALLWQSKELKEKEEPQSLPLQILMLEPDRRISTTTVTVSNTETATGVIKMATRQLDFPGRVDDLHLWVISGKEDVAYPLIGHEHPFSIALSSLRDAAERLPGADGSATHPSTDCPLDQLARGPPCRFILKPRTQGPPQLQREPLQKLLRRKKSLMGWALRKSLPSPSASPATGSPTTPHKLFGLSLSSICLNGALPKPILDLLLLLYQRGPSTQGIFRRSANAKSCKELKEKLNSGVHIPLGAESVLLAAALVTDFLRNIPDSVLSSDMHGLWMEAVDTENRGSKIKAIKSLVDQLPEANRLLLRLLFTVLRRIEANAGQNQMNALNLALCIAPNMLWPPSPACPQEESKSAGKVALLVQLLIENAVEIFGDDGTSLFQRAAEERSASLDHLLAPGRWDSEEEREQTADRGELGTQGSPPEGEHQDWGPFGKTTASYGQERRREARPPAGGERAAGGWLRPAWDRCASEPSVRSGSRPPTATREPVARQSSCDDALLRSPGDPVQRLKLLQLESQKLLGLGLGPARQRPPPPGPQGKPPLPQTPPPPTSLSSLSSLSSSSSSSSATTPSPTGSSPSSLDSAFSCCSEPSGAGPPDHLTLPFMFGTSARLRAFSPQAARRTRPDQRESPAPPQARPPEGPDPRSRDAGGRDDEEGAAAAPEPQLHGNWEGGERVGRAPWARSPLARPESPRPPSPGAPEGGGGPLREAPAQRPGKHTRTKITFYLAPGGSEAEGGGPGARPSTLRVPIPQTVFYGQNTPLVLQSGARSQRPPPGSPGPSGVPPSPDGEPPASVRHTIRIVLPASVRGTVRGYFRSAGPRSCWEDDAARAVEGELLRGRAEWQEGAQGAGGHPKEEPAPGPCPESFV